MLKMIKALIDREKAAEYRRNVAERERSTCASDINHLFADYVCGRVDDAENNLKELRETVAWCNENECGIPIYNPRYM